MVEQSSNHYSRHFDNADFEPLAPPFKLCLSDRYIQLSNSHIAIVNLILSGYTTKPQITAERGVSPHTVNEEFRTLYKNALSIASLNPQSKMSKIKLFSILLRAGAVLQVPFNQGQQNLDQNYPRRNFKIKIQKDKDRYINPYRITISGSYSELTSKQEGTIYQMLSGRTTYKEIGNINGITESAAKKRIGATENTQHSLRNIIIGFSGKDTSQRLGNFEIFLKLFEYGILRQVPVEFNRAILDNNNQHD